MATLPQLFAETVAARPSATALRWQTPAPTSSASGPGPTTPIGRRAWPRRSATSASGTATASCSCCATVPSSTSPTSPRCCSARRRSRSTTPLRPNRSSTSPDTATRKLAIVEDVGFLERFLKVRSELPALAHVAIIDDPDDARAGRRAPVGRDARRSAAVDIDAEVGNARPDDLLTVIYTSGTTGPPKGVMLDHDNMDWTLRSFREALEHRRDRLARRVVPADGARRGAHGFALQRDRDRGSRSRPVRIPGCSCRTSCRPGPQFFFAVPRVWEKAHAALRAAIGADPAKAEQFEQALEGRVGAVGGRGARRARARRVRGAVARSSHRRSKRYAGRSASTSARSR